MTTRVSVYVMAAAAFASLAAAQLADAAVYRFEGDRGTSCTVEVGAKASDSLGGLSGPPQVGYSSVPVCSYPPRAGAGNTAKQKRACRKAKKRGAKKRRGCKRPKRRAGADRHAAVAGDGRAAAVSAPALLDQAQLLLLGPLGEVSSAGEQTMAAAGVGYSCTLTLGAGCSDSGRLLPAIPGVTYVAQFSLHLSPPGGERWTQRPAAACSEGTVAACTLRSAPVSPQL